MQRYAITRRAALPPHPRGTRAALHAQAARWVAGGVEWVQVREKDLPVAPLEELVRQLAEITAGTPTRLLLNGLPPAEARACGADGVHLPGDASPAAIRDAVDGIGLVSVSCHRLDEIDAAREGGVSAILWAPVFEKFVDDTQVGSGSGLETLHAACALAGSVPVFALGGVSAANAEACLLAGAAGVAGIRLFAGEEWRRLPGGDRS